MIATRMGPDHRTGSVSSQPIGDQPLFTGFEIAEIGSA